MTGQRLNFFLETNKSSLSFDRVTQIPPLCTSACAWGRLTQRADVASYTTKASRAGRGSFPLAATTSRTLPLAGTSHATAFSSQLPAPPAGSADPHRPVSPSPNLSRPATPRRPLHIPPSPLLPLADAFARSGWKVSRNSPARGDREREDDGRARAAAAARLGAARSDPRLRPGNLSEPIEAVYFFPWNYGGEICNGSCGF